MKLYVFTAFFPFGSAENFFAEELEYLSKGIEQIIIYPGNGYNMPVRSYPYNCIIDKRLCVSKYKKAFFGCLYMWRVLPVYLKEIKIALSKKEYFFNWLKSMIHCSFLVQSDVLKDIEATSTDDDVIYSYWGGGNNNYLPFYKGKAKAVSRFHGDGDLWNSKDDEGYIPLRSESVKRMDCAIFISKIGESFFKNRYMSCRTKTFHLGSMDHGKGYRSDDGKLRIVSCSTIYPLKRVPLIYDSICKIDGVEIEWTHIGSCVRTDVNWEDELKDHIADNPKDNVRVVLKGWMEHEDVYEYYKNNPVDLFVNLSTNEGVPVSIMEAISFDVPVVATDVGATAEVVSPEAGELVSPNPTAEEVARVIQYVHTHSYTPREYWKKEFDADVNYSEFTAFLQYFSKL